MRFALGRTVATASAARLLAPFQLNALVVRHQCGDWGTVCDEDKQANEDAIKHGDRILSAYLVDGVKFYVITEADRSSTTCLLAEEY